MAQKLLSISLGTTSAKLAEIKKSGNKVQVFSAYDIPLSDGLCDDGVILDAVELAAELKHYISQYKIKAKDIVFSIASKRIASKEVFIPFVKEKQIRGIVEINAPEYFPVANIENYAINYSILEIVKKEDTSQYRLSVTATPNEILEGYMELAENMKRKVFTIDYAGNAILQVLKSQTVMGEVNAILQLGYENTVINIMNGSVLIMQRNVSNGLNALIASVCDSVGLDEEDATAFLEDNDIAKIAGAYPDVKYVVDSIITSIGRIFDFYNGRFADSPITGVRYIGDATFVDGISDALESGLGMPTEEIYTLSHVQVKSKKVTPEYATNFMANIGAVIASMNLKSIPKSADEAAKSEKLPWRLVILSFVAAVALVGSSLFSYFNTKSEKDDLEQKVRSIESILSLETDLNEAQAKSDMIQGIYDTTVGPSDTLAKLFEDMEKVMPKGMTVDSFNYSEGNVTFGAGGIGKESIGKFIIEMKALPYVRNVKVDYVSEVKEGLDPYDTFNMSFTIIYIDEEANDDAANVEAEIDMSDGEGTEEMGGEE